MTDHTRDNSRAIDRRTRRMAFCMRFAAIIGFVAAAAANAAPPSPLHEAMARLQSAAVGTNHAAFTGALDEAKRIASAAAAGEEKGAAQRALHVYDDLARLWRYSEESSTGAFFEGGELLTMVHAYPGYDKAVAADTVIAGEHTLYPTAESRAFLAREAALRLAARAEPPASASPPAPIQHQRRPPVLRKKPEEAVTKPTAPTPAATPGSPVTLTAAPAVVQPSTTRALPVMATPLPQTPIPRVAIVPATAPASTPVEATTAAPTTTRPPETTTTAPSAENPSTSSDAAPVVQPLNVAGTARTAIAIALIVAAVASLIYLFRSSE
jgi:hypothetical protein